MTLLQNRIRQNTKSTFKTRNIFETRLCQTQKNVFDEFVLHNIGDFENENFISPADALISDSGLRVDYVLIIRHSVEKSSMTATNEEGEQETDELTYNRQDFGKHQVTNKFCSAHQNNDEINRTSSSCFTRQCFVWRWCRWNSPQKLMETTTCIQFYVCQQVYFTDRRKSKRVFIDNKPASKQPWTRTFDFTISEPTFILHWKESAKTWRPQWIH